MLKYWLMYDLKATGERIRLAREARGLSKSELGRRMGTTHHHIGLIERGEIEAGGVLMARLADELSLSLDELMGRGATLIAEERAGYDPTTDEGERQVQISLHAIRRISPEAWDELSGIIERVRRQVEDEGR